ncbi:hypothetical protein QVD17_01683 [Tagetes erecta]|uniref:Uncharacterized protein n=1 Tax=Tagetes erecta TaxID=13708 RepID=A0AAD8LE33_TARER|nr:hypothetical protein QVD17_01683 [Tagetes erecta]
MALGCFVLNHGLVVVLLLPFFQVAGHFEVTIIFVVLNILSCYSILSFEFRVIWPPFHLLMIFMLLFFLYLNSLPPFVYPLQLSFFKEQLHSFVS